jgi:aminoglycoside phosphotransferase (APT) family kinase protein
LAGELSATLIAGGKSNLTYQVTDGAGTWIVRRPPLGHVLATAHDMAREYRVMTALRDTEVPVPTTYALCDDPAILGAPFYVMDRVEGTPYRRAEELVPLGADRVRVITTRLVDTLAALHRIEPESAPGIVHGDYRLDNVLIACTPEGDDRVAAVLDWEMATLGDPLTDLALMLLYQRLGATAGALVSDVAAAPGFLTEDEILARYTAGGGRDLSHFGFYLALAAFKLAAILEGIHYRYLQGQTVGPGFDHIGEAIHPLLAAGLDALDN